MSIMKSSAVLLNISFGIVINVIRIKRPSSKCSLLEDPFLFNGRDLEEGGNHDLGNNGNFWDFMTFKLISSVMNQGVLKQLDSDDLLLLLPDISPFCHDMILSSWRAQLSNNGSNPSLFRALYNAYEGSASWDGYLLALSLGITSIVKYTIYFSSFQTEAKAAI